MSNSIKQVNSVLNVLNRVDYQNYYAHISGERKETLLEHTELTYKYFQTIINENGISIVINRLIHDFSKKNYKENNLIPVKKYLIDLFHAVPIFHDLGKLNPDFQFLKMNNKFFQKQENSLGSRHSKISSFIFFQKFISSANSSNFYNEEKALNLFLLYCFCYPIKRHHSLTFEYDNEYVFYEDFVKDTFDIISEKDFFDFPQEILVKIGRKIDKEVLNNNDNLYGTFSLFALLKLNYSILTASDYYATSHFINNWDKIYEDFGILDKNIKIKIIKAAENSKVYNQKTYDEIDSYILDFPLSVSGANLNKLRQNLSIEVIRGIRNNIDKSLFYIEAPTGGGKTNLSILSIAEFLRYDIENSRNQITKIFYVFPFTTLITQTFQVLQETLNLNSNEIVQIHSKAGFSEKDNDSNYDDKKDNIIDYQFVNYPISLISHIKFFNILKSDKKSYNYLLHRIANSIVIIDELQAYSPKEWDKVVYFINNYSRFFNIKFLLMSATLPKIDKLLFDNEIIADLNEKEFVHLTADKDKYFINPNSKNRVEFDFSMLGNSKFSKDNRDLFLINLWEKVKRESENFRKNSNFGYVHTIIEFIFKQTVSEFLSKIKEDNSLFDEIFVLSGTILEPRRKEIISKLKSKEYKSKNILLITTQVVEAGVDIDMDIGFKDQSLIDSDEQLAGRINRNVGKSACKLFLFDLDNEKLIYGTDYRYKKIQTDLKGDYRKILENKNFDTVYNSVMEDRNKINRSADYINMREYIDRIKNLDFYSVNKDFKLIEDDMTSISIFVPLDVPIQISKSNEENLSKEEQRFLEKKGRFIKGDQFVSGLKVWSLYEDIIKNREKDFTKQRKDQIIMQGLLSKFSFSISIYSRALKDIITSGNCEEKYGFLYLHNFEEVYSYEEGIKSLTFEDTNIW